MSIKSLHDCQQTRYCLPMTPPADYHMHTPLCHHAKGEPVEYAARALELGLPEIGFSDHSPVEHDDQDDWRMLACELSEYVAKVQHARDIHPTLPIRLGLEVDFIPGHEPWIKEMASRHDWDYFIGSVHYISGKWDFDNPKRLAEWAEHDVDEVWTDYFNRLTNAAASGLFQIIGHPDLPKKFGHFPKHDPTSLYMDFLAACESTSTSIELNTAGLRKNCAEIYPSFEFLKLAKGSNVQITFGSDAHSPSEVGMNLKDATALAREAGYKQCCRLNKLEKNLVKF